MSIEATVSIEQLPDVANVITHDGRQMLMIKRVDFHWLVKTRAEALVESEAHRKRANAADVRASNWQTGCYFALVLALVLGLALIAEAAR